MIARDAVNEIKVKVKIKVKLESIPAACYVTIARSRIKLQAAYVLLRFSRDFFIQFHLISILTSVV